VIVEVEMVAFKEEGKDFGIRMVEIPDKEAVRLPEEKLLDLVYLYGQNDLEEIRARHLLPAHGVVLNPDGKFPSISVGDVIRLDGRRFLVGSMRFKEIGPEGKGGWKEGYGLTAR
jgi:hypothetical protein